MCGPGSKVKGKFDTGIAKTKQNETGGDQTRRGKTRPDQT